MRVQINPDQVKTSFGQFKDSATFEESLALMEQGHLPVEMLQAISLRPEILKTFATTGDSVYPGGLLERSLKEKVILKSSIKNNCQFCRDSHRAIMRQLDIPQIQIDELEAAENLTEREQLALSYTEAMMEDSNRVSDELFNQLKENFSDEEIVELTFLVGFINMLNMFNNALQVTFHEEYA